MSVKNATLVDRHIGRRIKMQRINLGMSQEALGEKIDLTFQQIQKYEKGINRVSATRLYDLAHVLDVEIIFFYEGLPARTVQPAGMEEGLPVEEYLDFVSSNEGMVLNQNFTRIRNKALRQSIVEMTKAIEAAQVDETKKPANKRTDR